MVGVKLFAIETDPQKKRRAHAMANRCIFDTPSVTDAVQINLD
jgi:hypothetical protein